MVVRDRPIKCPHCREDTGYTENSVAYLVVPPTGLKCKACDEVFMRNDRAEWVFACD